jgi:hypothetical protein
MTQGLFRHSIAMFLRCNDAFSRFLQDPRDPFGARSIGWYSAPPPPAPGWAPSFPLDIDVDLTKVPDNFTLQVCKCSLEGFAIIVLSYNEFAAVCFLLC